jgi:CheY-like chemotaxis protein
VSRILVIDDNELISKMLEHSLSEHGYEVRAALDANQGYAAALEFRPDLILLDVQLPDVAGFELCRVIKNRTELKDVPIIMITGTARSTEEKVKGFQMGVDDYVLKPFEMPELLERIKTILRRAESSRKPETLPLDASTPSKAADSDPGAQILPVRQALEILLLDPAHFPAKTSYPHIALAFVMGALVLAFAGLAATAGAAPNPALVGFSVVGVWGVLVAVLVMASSLLGISLSWKESARLLSLAGIPVLFKMTGAFACALWTSLSPFYFTASPALFSASAPMFLARLDVFELWTAYLVWILVCRRPQSSLQKAGIVAFLVWGTAAALVMGLGTL